MELLVDFAGTLLGSPPSPEFMVGAVGMREVVPLPSRLVWVTAGSQRYQPAHPPGEQCLFGMDFSFLLPAGVGIAQAMLQIFDNTFLAANVSADFVIGPVTISGRQVWAVLSGGVDGSDYQLRFQAIDTDGNVWPRTALLLCSQAG